MKCVINTALLQDKVIESLDGYDKDGITLKYVEKKGLKLFFDFTGVEPGYEGQSTIKKIVKSFDWAKTLYFSVTFE